MTNEISFETSDGDITVKHDEIKKIDSSFAMVCSCGDCGITDAVLKSTAKNRLWKRGWRYKDGGWKCPKCMQKEHKKTLLLGNIK